MESGNKSATKTYQSDSHIGQYIQYILKEYYYYYYYYYYTVS